MGTKVRHISVYERKWGNSAIVLMQYIEIIAKLAKFAYTFSLLHQIPKLHENMAKYLEFMPIRRAERDIISRYVLIFRP